MLFSHFIRIIDSAVSVFRYSSINSYIENDIFVVRAMSKCGRFENVTHILATKTKGVISNINYVSNLDMYECSVN